MIEGETRMQDATSQGTINRVLKTDVIIDSDIKLVASFMQQNLPASRLVAVAQGLAGIAPLLWSEYAAEQIRVIQLMPQPISDRDQRTLPSSIE